MSLKDQLLKAGLVTKKQVVQVESSQRKQDHAAKKNADLAKQQERERQAEQERLQAEHRQRQERDKELNKQRDQLVAKREGILRAEQLIKSNAQNLRDATERYYFAIGQVIKKVLVSYWQCEMLARGEYGIAKPYDDIDEFIVIPRDTALLIQEICPHKLVVLYSKIDDNMANQLAMERVSE